MSLIISFLTVFLTILTFGDDIIITPNTNKTNVGVPIGLIYIHGADIENSQYVPLVTQIQDNVDNPLYIALPDFGVDGLPSVIEFVILLPHIIKQLEAAGLPPNSQIFFGGHSLGGAMINGFTGEYQYNYTDIAEFKYAGQILNAAFITQKYRDPATQEIDIIIPSLTVGGELDGNLYVSRIIEQYYNQLMMASSTMGHNIDNIAESNHFNDNNTLLNFPVIIVDGMSHMQWAEDNDIPANVYEHDLVPSPDLSYTEAHEIQGEIIGCWMNLALNNSFDDGNCNYEYIYDWIMDSYVLAEPMINALKLEGNYGIKPPCDCDPLTCESTPECNGGSIWMSYMSPQQIMAGFIYDDNLTVLINNTDSFHPTYQTNPIHYANIDSNCSTTYADSKWLFTTTVTQNKYGKCHAFDTGGCPTSAYEMRHKMKSRADLYKCIYNDNYVEAEDYEICGKINQMSINWALDNAPQRTLDRYMQYGLQLRIGDDIHKLTGPRWTFPPLYFEPQCDNTTHRFYEAVHSEYLWVEPYSDGCKFVEDECGVHYCKVLSPARALEWIYTDGLRFNLSLATYNQEVQSC